MNARKGRLRASLIPRPAGDQMVESRGIVPLTEQGVRLSDLNDLYCFARVVDHPGFAPAGRALGEPESGLSRCLAALEERPGTRLIQRSTRSLSLTGIGEAYYRHCEVMPVPSTPDELVALPGMALGRPGSRHVRHVLGPDDGEARVDHRPRSVTHNMTALRSAAVAGVGVVQFPA